MGERTAGGVLSPRTVLGRLHRIIGLATALFVSLAGLTGSLLVYGPELEPAISPQLFPAPPAGATRPTPGELLQRAERLVPAAQADGVYLGDAERARVIMQGQPDPGTGLPRDIGFNELFLDPFTGRELGRNTWGPIRQGWHNLMPLVLEIHYSLVQGETGIWLIGLTALAWTLDCLVALLLTLPRWHRQGLPQRFWQCWWPAWRIKPGAQRHRLQVDLHRAGGLWPWALLAVFAWSGVMMNLGSAVYYPVMPALLPFEAVSARLPRPNAATAAQPMMGWTEAQQQLDRLLAEQSRLHGFTVNRPSRLYIDRERGVFFYDVHSSLDFQDKRGATTVYMDGRSGALRVLLPQGQAAGNIVTNWLTALHEANVFGTPYRLAVCVLGLVVAGLSLTGLRIWWRKRAAEATRRHRRRQ